MQCKKKRARLSTCGFDNVATDNVQWAILAPVGQCILYNKVQCLVLDCDCKSIPPTVTRWQHRQISILCGKTAWIECVDCSKAFCKSHIFSGACWWKPWLSRTTRNSEFWEMEAENWFFLLVEPCVKDHRQKKYPVVWWMAMVQEKKINAPSSQKHVVIFWSNLWTDPEATALWPRRDVATFTPDTQQNALISGPRIQGLEFVPNVPSVLSCERCVVMHRCVIL